MIKIKTARGQGQFVGRISPLSPDGPSAAAIITGPGLRLSTGWAALGWAELGRAGLGRGGDVYCVYESSDKCIRCWGRVITDTGLMLVMPDNGTAQ